MYHFSIHISSLVEDLLCLNSWLTAHRGIVNQVPFISFVIFSKQSDLSWWCNPCNTINHGSFMHSSWIAYMGENVYEKQE